MKKILTRLLPGYAWFPLVIVLAFNLFTYLVPRLIYPLLPYGFYDISLPIDHQLPFVPFFISIYLLSYGQWVLGFIMVGRESKAICYRCFSAELIAKFICLVLFLLLPTAMERPEITGDGLWERLTQMIYDTDAANNLFPSIHCLESWFCFRAALKLKKPGKWHIPFHLIFTLLVFASVVLVKQHLLLDIPAGILTVEIGLLCTRKFNFSRFFETVNGRFKIKTKRSIP